MTRGGIDRFLRYDELRSWLTDLAEQNADLVTLDVYGRSYEGRDLLIVTVTDSGAGPAATKPAQFVDASIHAIELTATVAACHLLRRLVEGYRDGDEQVVRALRTRTFYVVPRVNPDGAEWALADRPRFRRSSVRPWPASDAHRWPGLHLEDVDGDGCVLQMRLPDPDGHWMPHHDDARLMIPVPASGVSADVPRFRVLTEGVLEDFDGFTTPGPPPPEGLDLNRNYPAGWSTTVSGSGDHPLSEPEIDALVRAIVDRPNVCGFNAYHTSGGVLLRPSSTAPDADLPQLDVWTWKELAAVGTELTGYPSHSVFEDFTWDRSQTMSGAADDWAYEHLGVYGWTTEFWDIVHAATGDKQSTHFWYLGPTDDQALAVLRWLDRQPASGARRDAGFVDWYPFDHPQLGPVELGGWNAVRSWFNPPDHLLRAEVESHADFAIHQALAAPCLAIAHTAVKRIGDDTWRVSVGVANTGWLPTTVTERARKEGRLGPVTVEISGAETADPARVDLGQLDGRRGARFRRGDDGSPDRGLARWIVRAPAGAVLTSTARHDRAGNGRRRDHPAVSTGLCDDCGAAMDDATSDAPNEVSGELFAAALRAHGRAYAPYSGYPVGAAVRTVSGEVFVGCNVENAAYPLGNCAEQAALAAMVLGGGRTVTEVVVVTSGRTPGTPCGGCRQRIREFAQPETLVHATTVDGNAVTMTMQQLLPVSFGPDHLEPES